DEERLRNAEQTVIPADPAVVVNDVRERKPEFVDEGTSGRLPALVKRVDADDGQVFPVLLPHLLQERSFNSARFAPFRPEVDDDGRPETGGNVFEFTAMFAYEVPVHGQAERRHFPADHAGGDD